MYILHTCRLLNKSSEPWKPGRDVSNSPYPYRVWEILLTVKVQQHFTLLNIHLRPQGSKSKGIHFPRWCVQYFHRTAHSLSLNSAKLPEWIIWNLNELMWLYIYSKHFCKVSDGNSCRTGQWRIIVRFMEMNSKCVAVSCSSQLDGRPTLTKLQSCGQMISVNMIKGVNRHSRTHLWFPTPVDT